MLALTCLLRRQVHACAVAASGTAFGAPFSSSSFSLPSSSSSAARPKPSSSSTLRLFFAPPSSRSRPQPLLSSLTFSRGAKWSVETEKGHVYRNPDEIIDDAAIVRALESTKAKARDPAAVAAVLEAAKERAFLKAPPPAPSSSEGASSNSSAELLPEPGPSEFVRGLSLEEAALLLNVDAHDAEAMKPIFDTAFAIKNRIYGNRVVLFAPLYIANWCVNSCRYCAFR